MTNGQKACLSGDRCQPRSIGEAFYCLVHHSMRPNGSRIDPAEIARALGKRLGYILQAANPDCDDVALQASVLIPATRFTGNTIAIRFIASETGGVYFQLPEVMPGHEDLFDRLTLAMEEVGKDAGAIREALRNDGRIDASEAPAIVEEIDNSIAALAQLRDLVKRKATPSARLSALTTKAIEVRA